MSAEGSGAGREWRPPLLLSCLLYLILTLPQLHLPGLYYDEALDAVPAVELLEGRAPQGALATLRLAGREWPLMILSYVGPTSTYLLLPLFGLLGVGVVQLRLLSVLLGLLTLALFYGFLRDALDERAAAWATALLATQLSFVAWSRAGIPVSYPVIPLAVASAWLVHRWGLAPTPARFLLTGLAWGAGVATKILFVWVVAGQLTGFAWARGRAALRLPPAGALAGAAGAAVGGLPLLLFNLRGLGTLETLRRNAQSTELYGVRNTDLAANFLTRLWNLWELGSGAWAADHGSLLPNPVMGLALLATPWAALLAVRSASSGVRYLLGITLTAFALSHVTISSLGAAHLFIVLPFLVGLLAWLLLRHAPRPRLLLSLLLASNLAAAGGYHLGVQRTGGLGWFSDAVYPLADYLLESAPQTTAALDWGIARNLQVLTRDRVRPLEVFAYGAPGEELGRWFLFLHRDPEVRYLAHAPAWEAFPGHRREVALLAREHFQTLVTEASFHDRRGEAVLEVLRLEPMQPGGEVPAEAQRVGAILGERIRLEAVDWESSPSRPGETLALTVWWRALEAPGEPLTAFLHLLDEELTLRAQVDRPPTYGTYPPEAWRPGDLIADFRRLSLPADLPPGTYRLYVGMYRSETGERLPLELEGRRLEGDLLELGGIEVER